MSLLLKKRTLLAGLIAVASFAQADTQKGFTITPSIGYYNFDNVSGIQNDAAYSLGLGYQFDNPWAVEFVYLNADSEASFGGRNVDVDQYRLDGLYHFDISKNFTPYVATGVGQTDTNPGENNTLVNTGGGIKYALNDYMSLRGDFRLVRDLEDHALDNVTSLGLQFTFGNSTKEVVADIVEEKIDTDNDGVEDSYDSCLTTPSGVSVDTQGCALDDDRDGVANHLDQCANTTAGAKTDAMGCYLALEAPKYIQLDIQFASNSAVIGQAYYAQIKEVADFLKAYPEADAIIEGHTDNRGAESYNQTISEKRARAVASVLTNDFAISADRLLAVGYGEAKPLVENNTEANRALNRRVTAVISSK